MSCLQQERRQNDVSWYTRRAAPTSTPTSPRSGPFVDGFPLHTLIFELIDFEGLVWVRLALLRRGIFICGPSASPSSTALRPALSDRRQALSEGTDHYRDGARIIERSDQERAQTSSGR